MILNFTQLISKIKARIQELILEQRNHVWAGSTGKRLTLSDKLSAKICGSRKRNRFL